MEYTTEVIKCKNGKTTIRRPILTSDEREKRMQSLRAATERYAKVMLQAQQKKEGAG